jgi:methionine salvage enolase-phosphatase E1
MHYTEDGFIKITDSALVSYLTVKGYTYSKIEIHNNQALFLFVQSEALDKEIKDFYQNTGGFLGFHKSYRQILRDINNAVREQGNG